MNGTGEVIGSLSFAVGHGANMLKKIASARMSNQPYNVQNIISYPLKRRVNYLFHFMNTCSMQLSILSLVFVDYYNLTLHCFLYSGPA